MKRLNSLIERREKRRKQADELDRKADELLRRSALNPGIDGRELAWDAKELRCKAFNNRIYYSRSDKLMLRYRNALAELATIPLPGILEDASVAI